MADYAAKPTKAKEDVGIIELRKRMLAVFLNRCRRMDEVREDGVWWRFLDPNASWVRLGGMNPCSREPFLLMTFSAERSSPHSASLSDTQERPQGATARYCKPHSGTQLPPSAGVIRQIKVSRRPLLEWYTDVTTALRRTALGRGTHDTWPTGVWQVPTLGAEPLGGGTGPLFCQLRVLVKGVGAAAARQHGEGQPAHALTPQLLERGYGGAGRATERLFAVGAIAAACDCD